MLGMHHGPDLQELTLSQGQDRPLGLRFGWLVVLRINVDLAIF